MSRRDAFAAGHGMGDRDPYTMSIDQLKQFVSAYNFQRMTSGRPAVNAAAEGFFPRDSGERLTSPGTNALEGLMAKTPPGHSIQSDDLAHAIYGRHVDDEAEDQAWAFHDARIEPSSLQYESGDPDLDFRRFSAENADLISSMAAEGKFVGMARSTMPPEYGQTLTTPYLRPIIDVSGDPGEIERHLPFPESPTSPEEVNKARDRIAAITERDEGEAWRPVNPKVLNILTDGQFKLITPILGPDDETIRSPQKMRIGFSDLSHAALKRALEDPFGND